MKIAYVDAFSGISGDMMVGALLHLGVSLETIREELSKLPLSGYHLRQTGREQSGIQAVKFHVEVHDPLHERSFRAIARMLRDSPLNPSVQETALRIFTVLAEAEGRVHGVATDAVHFHEVGAIDSIVDIVGTAVGLQALGIERVYVSPLPMGTGFVSSRHGVLPIPGPATVELLKGWPVRLEDGGAEMVTPTGAAIVAAVGHHGVLPPVQVSAIGYGAGERTLPDRPNLLRIMLGDTSEDTRDEPLLVLETNIDDLNPEFYEYVMERLFAAGARDVVVAPIQMKKNRPGILLWVLCDPGEREQLSGIIFAETSTLGIRSYPVTRTALRRDVQEVTTVYGTVRVKVAYTPDGRVRRAPEYEDCKRLARERAVPLTLVYEAALLKFDDDNR
ncbi:MAG: nickel pincer cofactor biosynthesis protein LarC [Deltaproteobacteria bacterium]|nr:nickel pincer cofactor biosynthesis protein LarC [Deltaproteobacteria bacterium]